MLTAERAAAALLVTPSRNRVPAAATHISRGSVPLAVRAR